MSRSTALKISLLVILIAAIAGVMLSPLREHMNLHDVRLAVDATEAVWYGPILFVLAFAVGSVLFVPATLFIIAAGLVWGWKLGVLYALTGGTLGAVASFAIAKYLGGGVIARFGERGRQVAAKLDHAGFRTLLILRLIPLWPFPVFNYAAGLANVRYRDFIASTLIGLSPAMLVMTYSADALVSGTLSGGEAMKRLALAGVLVGLLVLIPTLLRKRTVKSLHLESPEP